MTHKYQCSQCEATLYHEDEMHDGDIVTRVWPCVVCSRDVATWHATVQCPVCGHPAFFTTDGQDFISHVCDGCGAALSVSTATVMSAEVTK